MKIIKGQLSFNEVINIVNDAVDACFKVDENGNDVDFRPECKKPCLQCSFFQTYTDMEFVEDFAENFDKYMALDINDLLTSTNIYFNKKQWDDLVQAVDEKVEFRKQKLINSQPKPVDEAFDMLTTLLTTLNNKAQEIDVKKIEKQLKKFNVNEVVKAYQKNNIFNGVEK